MIPEILLNALVFTNDENLLAVKKSRCCTVEEPPCTGLCAPPVCLIW
jgi:hypothetical protein